MLQALTAHQADAVVRPALLSVPETLGYLWDGKSHTMLVRTSLVAHESH